MNMDERRRRRKKKELERKRTKEEEEEEDDKESARKVQREIDRINYEWGSRRTALMVVQFGVA